MPCQPFSVAGKKLGENDPRHLWPHIREAIRVLRPRITFLENVSNHRRIGFDRVLGDCAEDGLHVRWATVRASDVGAPHQRERLFFVITDPDGEQHEEWRLSVAGASEDPPLTSVTVLFPTPRTTDSQGGADTVMGGSTCAPLLPTPNASDASGGAQHPARRKGHSRQLIDFALVFANE